MAAGLAMATVAVAAAVMAAVVAAAESKNEVGRLVHGSLFHSYLRETVVSTCVDFC